MDITKQISYLCKKYEIYVQEQWEVDGGAGQMGGPTLRVRAGDHCQKSHGQLPHR